MTLGADSAVDLPAGDAELDTTMRWSEDRLERSLLVLGDLTPPLRPLARHRALYREPGGLCGLAVVFEGFGVPIASVVSDDAEAAGVLLDWIGEHESPVVVVSSLQVLPDSLESRTESVDPWMVAPVASSAGPGGEGVEPVTDAAEVQSLLWRLGMRFWCPDMLRFGHAFGVRSASGRLVAFGGVNFVLDRIGYAQIGPLVTEPGERGRSLGSRVLAAVRASLAVSGVQRCGVFADAADSGLVGFYARRGFTVQAEFAFLSILPPAGYRSIP